MSGRIDLRLRLPDGRFFGYAEYGDPDGRPVLFFHGCPGSRRTGALLDETAARLGLRVIAPERPGYGLSDFQPRCGFPEWADDVSALADALGIERFAVLGMSGGGPYALACAAYIPDRLTAAGVAGGNAPPDLAGAWVGFDRRLRFAIALGHRAPVLLRVQLSLVSWLARRDPERLAAFFVRALPPADRAMAERSRLLRRLIAEDYVEAARQGGRGFTRDFAVMAHPWGFDMSAVRVPVHFWRGEEDRNVPVSSGRAMAKAVPGSHATFYTGEGHFAIFAHQEEVLRELTA